MGWVTGVGTDGCRGGTNSVADTFSAVGGVGVVSVLRVPLTAYLV